MEALKIRGKAMLKILEEREAEAKNTLALVRACLQRGDFDTAVETAHKIGRFCNGEIVALFKEFPRVCSNCGTNEMYFFNQHHLKWKKWECPTCRVAEIREDVRKELPEILTARGVAKRFLTTDISDFPEHYQSFAKTNSGLFVFGPRGVGKTHLMAALMKEEILNVVPPTAWDGMYGKDAVSYLKPVLANYPLFISVPELLLEIKNTFNRHEGEDESAIIDRYSLAKTLFLDDLGAEKASSWALQTLYVIIDRRYGDLKKTVISSNFTLDQIADKLDDRISSRIAGMCKIVKIEGKDRRIQRE